MKWRVEFRVGSSVQLEYCFLPPGSFSDEQSKECVGEIRKTQREENRTRDGQKRDLTFIFILPFSFVFERKRGSGDKGLI